MFSSEGHKNEIWIKYEEKSDFRHFLLRFEHKRSIMWQEGSLTTLHEQLVLRVPVEDDSLLLPH